MTLSMVVEHLSMVVFAIVIAILIGVPLGLLCYLSRAARGVVLRVVDLIQTTPALALLGIIMVTPLGAGKPTVILGLALYSLLPIVRNVTLGLSQVSPAVKEAAKGMGMTRVYSLFHVELPLAMPMLFTGLRIAVVNAIGTAVFASSVGGGGLGNLINTGIRRNDVAMILSGTAALMAMALLLDNLMAFCERRMGRRDSSRRPGRHAVLRRRLTAGAAAVLVAALCLPSLLPKDTSSTLVLYDGEFSEVQLVNRMVQQLVEDRTGLEVNILDPMTSINNFKELTAREPSCDLMYTWDGTILTTFLGLDTSDIPAGHGPAGQQPPPRPARRSPPAAHSRRGGRPGGRPVPALPAAQGHLQHPCPLRRGVLRGSVGQPHGAAACGGPHGAGGQHTRPHDLDQQLQGAHRAGAEL